MAHNQDVYDIHNCRSEIESVHILEACKVNKSDTFESNSRSVRLKLYKARSTLSINSTSNKSTTHGMDNITELNY